MGFYNDEQPSNKNKKGAGKWVAVAVLSALVGSGTTLAMAPFLHLNTSIPASAASTLGDSSSDGSTVPVSNVNVNVNDGITQAVKQVEPAVMAVVNYSRVSDFWTQQTKLQESGVGTGVLFHKDGKYGYIVTNNHVVEGAAKVELVMGSGKHINAQVVGTDPFTDLAVIKADIANFKGINTASFANSDAIQVGEPAIAIGTPMGLDFADSVTAGIISAKKRIMPVEEPQSQQTLDYQAVIQTDAAINPGNSGGPLLNIKGEVVGINSSKIVAPNFEGMGFAIPSNEVRAIADQIMQTGHALHPALGISAYSLATIPQQYWPDVPVDYGVWVKAVTSSEAKSAGLQAQDVIVAIDGHDVKSMADLRTYLFQLQPGQSVTLRVYRGSQQKDIKVKLTEMSTQTMAQDTSPDNGDSNPGDPFNIPNWLGN